MVVPELPFESRNKSLIPTNFFTKILSKVKLDYILNNFNKKTYLWSIIQYLGVIFNCKKCNNPGLSKINFKMIKKIIVYFCDFISWNTYRALVCISYTKKESFTKTWRENLKKSLKIGSSGTTMGRRGLILLRG